MMFGIAGAALAMVQTAKNKKAAIGLVVSAAIPAHSSAALPSPSSSASCPLLPPVHRLRRSVRHPSPIITYYSGFRAASASPPVLLTWSSPPACRCRHTWMIISSGHCCLRRVLPGVPFRHHQVRPERPPAVRTRTRKPLRPTSPWPTTTTLPSPRVFWLLSAARSTLPTLTTALPALRFEIKDPTPPLMRRLLRRLVPLVSSVPSKTACPGSYRPQGSVCVRRTERKCCKPCVIAYGAPLVKVSGSL